MTVHSSPPKTVNVLIFYPSGGFECTTIDNSLSALQKIVGGHIEAVYDPHCIAGHAYCNDEGMILGLPLNANAEKYFGVRICGNVVLLSHDERGEECSVRIEQIKGVLNSIFGLPQAE